MNALKNVKVRMVRGAELRVKRERHTGFWAWQREDGTFVQTDTCRSELWTRNGIAFVKVTAVITTFKDAVPNAQSDERDMVEQIIEGTLENTNKYLADLSVLKCIEYTDTGAKVEWVF